jgi:hypothetical protein
LDKKIKDILHIILIENFDSIGDHPDNKLFSMYKYLISAIKNKDKKGIMNRIAVENLFFALGTPVLSIEVINILTFITIC